MAEKRALLDQCPLQLTDIEVVHTERLWRVASAAAVPAAWPMTKQAPVTRAADCPSCVIDAQRPATSRLSTPPALARRGSSMRYGRWL
jgi:hypothetical protein